MSTTNRGRKRQAPTESSKHSDTNDNLSADDGMSVPGTATFDETFSQVSQKRRRRKFSPHRRGEVARVRKVGACAECKARKVRCSHALQGADAHPACTPALEPSPQPFPFEFEKSYPEIEYPQNDWENGPGPWARPEEAQYHDLSFNDGDHLIATVPASTKRQERLALDLDDIDNIIGDNSRSSASRTVPNTPEWGRNSQWMMDATALANNPTYSQPSTTAYSFSNQNFSVEPGPLSSTPASSSADLLSPRTQDAGHYRCQVAGCDDSRVFTQEIHLRHHQETKHVELFQPETTFACPVLGCRTGRYAKRERLQMHIACTHPETLESPTQLPTSELSERGPQFDMHVQVSEFLDGPYVAGMEETPISIPVRRASGEIHLATSDSWLRAKSPRKTGQQRTYRKPQMRRSSSPMKRQHSARINDDSIHITPGQTSIANNNHGFSSTATNSMASLHQHRSLQVRNTVEQRGEFDVQHGMSQGYPLRTNSPTPSFIGQFANNMHVSDPPHFLKTSSEVSEDVIGASIPRGPQGMYGPATSTAFARSWNSDNQPMVPLTRDTFGFYQNNPMQTQLEVGFQPSYNDPSTNVSGWPGNDLSTTAGQTDLFAADYSPLDLQSNIPRYLADVESSLKFPLAPNSSRQPMILLNDDALLHTHQGNPFPHASNTLNLDPSPYQNPSLPRLEPSAMSSSGASESLVSPVDAPTLFSNNYETDEWEMDSGPFRDFNNMDVNMNNEPM